MPALKKIIPLIALMIFVATNCMNAYARARESDSLELVRFYNSIGKDNFLTANNWLTDSPLGDWQGINLKTIYDGSDSLKVVDTLALSNNHFAGLELSLDLPDLILLDLSNNGLAGHFPSLNLPKLKYLDLSYNQIDDELLQLDFPDLKVLFLSNNKIHGALPKIDLDSLELLNLSFNRMSGAIPPQELPRLQEFVLDMNRFCGPIPELGFPSITAISAKGNKLSGEVPDFPFEHLEYLDLSENELTGRLPAFGQTNLKVLRMGGNRLIGPIPNYDLQMLSELSVPGNLLSGDVPNFEHAPLAKLQVQGNKYLFGNLTKAPLLSYFSYSGQDTLYGADIKAIEDEKYILSPDNKFLDKMQYQWQKKEGGEWSNIQSGTKRQFTASSGDAIYRCQLTNPILPDLRLYTREVDMSINSTGPKPEGPLFSFRISGEKLKVELDRPASLDISIYSVQGQKIKEIASGPALDIGSYEFPLAMGNCANGVYICVITSKKGISAIIFPAGG
jgi:hypothetical protein